MRQEKFKMERQGLINVGDEIEISEYQSFMNYSYIIEPAVAMSGCYPNAQRIKSKKGIVRKDSSFFEPFLYKTTIEWQSIFLMKKNLNYYP